MLEVLSSLCYPHGNVVSFKIESSDLNSNSYSLLDLSLLGGSDLY